MNILLDILGSIITGGLVLLIHIGLLSKMSTVSSDLLISNINAINTTEAVKIIETDFYKIGFRDTTGNIFELAEKNAVKFKAPVKQDSLPKSIHYFLGLTTQMLGTKNPNDKPLLRQVAGENAIMIGIVNDFRLTYLDSSGIELSYVSLSSSLQRNKIRSLGIYVKVESDATVITNETNNLGTPVYPFVEWRKTIVPRNLK